MRTLILSAAAAGACTALATAQTPRVIFSEIPGDPTSLVPEGAGVPAGTRFDSFDRPYRSPDGTQWILSASTDLDLSEDEVIILGTGTSGVTVVREGTEFGSPVPGVNVGFIDRNLSLLDDGRYAFATNTDGPSGEDELLVVWDGFGWVAIVQEGGPVPGIPNEVFGSTLRSVTLLQSGVQVAYNAESTVGDLPSDQDDFLIIGESIVAQAGVTAPGNQAGGATAVWDNFDTDDFYTSPDGSTWIAKGDLEGDTGGDDVVVLNGDVVLQEGAPIAGASLATPAGFFNDSFLLPGGSWIVRGDDADDRDWVVRDGAIIALRDEPIVTGASETFSDAPFSSCFFFVAGNAAGDVVVGGTTSNADENADAVLVLNGDRVIARQGDAVDVDGDGVADDFFIDIFNNDDAFLTEDGRLHFMAQLNDAAGEDVGQAFLVLDTNAIAACPSDIDGNGEVGFDDLLVVLDSFGTCALPCETGCPGDVDGSCSVDFDDLLTVIAAFGPCP